MTIPYASVLFSSCTEVKEISKNIPQKRVIFIFSNVRMATAEINLCKKKTKRTIPSEQLPIVRLDQNKRYYEASNKLHKTEEGGSTTPRGTKRRMPPPRKAFSHFKNFYQYGKFNICGSRICICW